MSGVSESTLANQTLDDRNDEPLNKSKPPWKYKSKQGDTAAVLENPGALLLLLAHIVSLGIGQYVEAGEIPQTQRSKTWFEQISGHH
jgi:hypothetical protein